MSEKFEDTNTAIRSHQSKDSQYNGKKKKRTKGGLNNSTNICYW